MPPLRIQATVPLSRQANTVFLKEKMLYTCTPETKRSVYGRTLYTLEVYDLEKQMRIWRLRRTLCVFKQTTHYVYVVLPNVYAYQLHIVQLQTGLLIKTFPVIRPHCTHNTPIGSGIALVHPEASPSCSSRFSIVEGYVLIQGRDTLHIYDRYLGKPFWTFQPSISKQTPARILEALIHKGRVYVLYETHEAPVDSVPLTSTSSFAPRQGKAHLQLHAYNLKTQRLIWAGTHLPYGIQQARMYIQKDKLYMQMSVTQRPPPELDNLIIRQDTSRRKTESIWVYNWMVQSQTGRAQWREPWIIEAQAFPNRLAFRLSSALFHQTLGYTQIGKKLYAFSFRRDRPIWSRNIQKSTPGLLRVIHTDQILFENHWESFIFDAKQGTEQLYWRPRLLYPFTHQRTDSKALFTLHTRCTTEDGSTVITTQRDSVWIASHCHTMETELHRFYQQAGYRSVRYPVPLPKGLHGLTWLTPKRLFVFHEIAQKPTLYSFLLPQ